jgi:hypothetical protein
MRRCERNKLLQPIADQILFRKLAIAGNVTLLANDYSAAQNFLTTRSIL